MNNNLKTAITAVASVAVVGVAVKQSIDTRKKEIQKRNEFKHNMKLDTAAIEEARLVMTKKIASGEYPIGSLGRLQRDMQTEIEFQKIAIREEF